MKSQGQVPLLELLAGRKPGGRVAGAAALAAAIGLMLPLAAGTARAEDEIRRTEGAAPLRVDRITSETYEEVKYRKQGVSTEQRLSADKVADIIYDDAPATYTTGLSFFESYDYENAISSLRLALEEKGVRDWIQTYARYWIGKCYQAWGANQPAKLADAIKAYQDLLTHNPMARLYPEALLNLAACYAQSGDLSNATATYDRLAKDAYDKKLGVTWEARAKYEKAAAKLNGELLDEAERDFRSAETFCSEQAGKSGDPVLTADLSRMAGMARLSQGLVMIQRKKFKDAQGFFGQILSNAAESPEVHASAQNGLAECYLAEGKLKDAQTEFATAKVRFGGFAEEAAKATYFLGRCCLELKDAEPQYKKKADDYFEEVIAYYPATRWAKEAQKMLKSD